MLWNKKYAFRTTKDRKKKGEREYDERLCTGSKSGGLDYTKKDLKIILKVHIAAIIEIKYL